MQHTLIGTLLFEVCPIVYQASFLALRKAGLMTARGGNPVLTAQGMGVALKIHQNKSHGLVGKTRASIARLKKVA